MYSYDVWLHCRQRRSDACRLWFYSAQYEHCGAFSSIGIGFTQTPAIFKMFPTIIKSVFAENCVAVVFVVAFALNLIFPSELEMEKMNQ